MLDMQWWVALWIMLCPAPSTVAATGTENSVCGCTSARNSGTLHGAKDVSTRWCELSRAPHSAKPWTNSVDASATTANMYAHLSSIVHVLAEADWYGFSVAEAYFVHNTRCDVSTARPTDTIVEKFNSIVHDLSLFRNLLKLLEAYTALCW